MQGLHLCSFRGAARVFERASDGCTQGRLVATTGIVYEQSAKIDRDTHERKGEGNNEVESKCVFRTVL
jgi:hypothetical protein